MREWSVRIEVNIQGRTVSEEQADEVLAALKDHAPALTVDRHLLSVRLCVRAARDDALPAGAAAERLLNAALKRAGIVCRPYGIEAFEIETLEGLDRRLQGLSNDPWWLVGVAELAEILKVSKQRASELAQMPSFPRPIAQLASGPIWKKTAILRHVGRWPRRPGRPKKTAPTAD